MTPEQLAEAIHRVRNHAGTDTAHEEIPHPHSMDTTFADAILAEVEIMHEHEWQPAGVSSPPNFPYVNYVWGMCRCGEIMLRQWDS